MKRLWKTSFLFVLALTMILPLSGCNFGSSPIPDPPPKLSIPLNKLNVDWDKAVADALDASIYTSDDQDILLTFSEYDDISLSVSDHTIACNVDIAFSSPSSAYRKISYLLRALNAAAKEQDDRITESDLFTYGGLYDVADLQVKITSEQGVYIDDTLPAGEHRRRGLRLSGDNLSVEWYACADRFRELYPSDYDPTITGAAIVPYVSSDEGNEKAPILALSIGVLPGTSQQEAKEAGLKAMETFNQLCQRFDPSISDFSYSEYGGVYDYIFMAIKIVELDVSADILLDDKNTFYLMWLEPGEYENLDDNIGFDEELNKIITETIFEYMGYPTDILYEN